MPLLDSDNVIAPDLSKEHDAKNSSSSNLFAQHTQNEENSRRNHHDSSFAKSSPSITNSNQTTHSQLSSSILANPILSILTFPITIMFQVLTNFQQYMYTNFINSNSRMEDSEFISTIPQEQEALQNDLNGVKSHQHNLGRNIDDLSKRIERLEKRRKTREEKMKGFRREYMNVSSISTSGPGEEKLAAA